MPYKRRRMNPKLFTADDGYTVGVMVSEGNPEYTISKLNKLDKGYRYTYRQPSFVIRLCNREILEPIERATGHKITPKREKRQLCKPEDFPPDGKGRWQIRIGPKQYRRLKPLIPKTMQQKWEESWRRKKVKPP